MKRIEVNQIIEDDFYRYYGYKKYSFDLLNVEAGIKFIKILRLAQYYKNTSKLKYLYYKLLHRKMMFKYGYQIPINTSIGRGFYLGHFGNVVINGNTKIGKNVNIANGVTIGRTNRGDKKGYPTIGDNVWIGANSVIVGDVNIGNNVLVAPLTYINVDIPSNSIVLGNPAKIISRQDATEGYVQNRV